jgi:hypothetical protein
MTLNQLRRGYQRIADIYGLPGQHHPRPSLRQIYRLAREARGLWSDDRSDSRNDRAAEAVRGSARGSRPGESNADPRSVSTESMRGAGGFPPATVADFH